MGIEKAGVSAIVGILLLRHVVEAIMHASARRCMLNAVSVSAFLGAGPCRGQWKNDLIMVYVRGDEWCADTWRISVVSFGARKR